MRNITLPIVIEGDSDGYYVSCPALQGCYSQGDTYEEAVANIKDAIRLHLEDRIADGDEIPHTSDRRSQRVMTRLPRLTAREICAVLERSGFAVARQSGSHIIYKNSAGKRVTAPFHVGPFRQGRYCIPKF
jgi:predicted RNase H-like HicB family nuclease/predicted RNA binding protein YcfA (HicA-like mRNA interferase family)